MSLPYRGHGPHVLHQAFKLSCFAGNTLLGLVGCPTEEACARHGYCPGPTDVRSTAPHLTKRSDTLPQRLLLERTGCALPSTQSIIEVGMDRQEACSDIKLNDETGERILPKSPKTHLMSLPVGIRALILHRLLGDRKIHVHYEQRVTCDSDDQMSEEACTGFTPQYSFCCHKRYRNAERRTGKTIKRKSYEDRHLYCFKQPGGKSPVDDPNLGTLQIFKDCDYVNDSRWSRLFTDRLSVLMVTKTLRKEALEAFYSTNTFSFGDHVSFNIFIRRISAERAALIRKLEMSAKLECDARYTKFGIYFPTELPSNWIFEDSDTDKLQGLQKVAKLANVTDITLRLHDKVPVVQKDLRSWKTAKDHRLSRLKLSLNFAFMGFALPMNIKRVNVRIVCAANTQDQDLSLQEQADYELDKNALRVVEDEFASELEEWRTIHKTTLCVH